MCLLAETRPVELTDIRRRDSIPPSLLQPGKLFSFALVMTIEQIQGIADYVARRRIIARLDLGFDHADEIVRQ